MRTLGKGVSGVGHGAEPKRKYQVRLFFSPSALRLPSQSRLRSTAPPKGEPRAGTNSLARRALPLLGEVPSAHTGERGLRSRTRSRREKTERSADNSFPYWHSLSHGDPSVSLALASSPKRGAKGVDSAPAPQGAADLVVVQESCGVHVPSPRRALPLLGEVPSAHTGERGLRSRTRCRAEKKVPSTTILFPIGTPTALSVSLALDSSPEGGAKGVDGDPSVSLALASSPKRGAKGVDGNPSVSLSHPQAPP